VTSRRNCKKCHRWRPISDFPVYYHPNYNTEYIKWKCNLCIKEYQKIYAMNLRRRKGILQKSVDPVPLIRLSRSYGWNNIVIAKESKVNVRNVRNWVHGRMNMSTKAADNLCIALGTSLEIVYPYA
jgi:hypothetical protein